MPVSTAWPAGPVDRAIAAAIDHTILRADATRDDIVRICGEARRYLFASVCVNPYWVGLAAAQLAGSGVKVCSVVGFPLGASATETKRAETEAAIRCGAREIDMVINIGALKSGMKKRSALTSRPWWYCTQSGAITKVILETAS
ncbi:MAG: deoxyribose-phosphate aldolase [Bryobacteraceae bacterium]